MTNIPAEYYLCGYGDDAKVAFVRGYRVVRHDDVMEAVGVTAGELALAEQVSWRTADELHLTAATDELVNALWFSRHIQQAQHLNAAVSAFRAMRATKGWLDRYKATIPPDDAVADALGLTVSGAPPEMVAEIEADYAAAQANIASIIRREIEPLCIAAATKIHKHLGERGLARLVEGETP